MKNGSVLSREKIENRKNLKRAIFSVRWGRRYYNPELGRWLNRDPIGEEGGWNTYGFVENRPLQRIDFLGMFFRQVVFAWSEWHDIPGTSFCTTRPLMPELIIPGWPTLPVELHLANCWVTQYEVRHTLWVSFDPRCVRAPFDGYRSSERTGRTRIRRWITILPAVPGDEPGRPTIPRRNIPA